MPTLDLRGSGGTLRLAPNGGTATVRSFLVLGPKGDKGDAGAPGAGADITAAQIAAARDAAAASAAAAAASAPQPPGYDLVILAGQSNVSGRGTPFSTVLDPANPRVKQWKTHGTTGIQPAAEPLDMHDTPTGIGPGFQFARWYAARKLSANRQVLLVPVAHGGTPLSSTATPLGWRRGVAGNLYENMITQAQAALAAANAIPNTSNKVVAVLWLQGETDGDNNITSAAYKADLDAVISGSRTDLSLPALPWVVGTMVPEYLQTGTRKFIDMVHRDTPNRLAAVDVAVGPKGANMGDGNHYNAVGQRLLGRAFFDAFERLSDGIAPFTEALPADFGPVTGLVAATPTNGNSQPLTWATVGLATSYLVEFRLSGDTTWVTAGTPTSTSFTVGGLMPSTSYEYRVSPVNASGTGYSTTVSASTAAATTVVTDTFTRADNAASLGSAETGQVWSAVTGTWGIGLGKAFHGSTNNSVAVLDSTKADAIVRLRFATLTTTVGDLQRLLFRGDGTVANYWMVQYRQSTNSYQLYKNVANVFTKIGNDMGVAPANGDLIEANFTGSQIVIRVNGVVQQRATDTDLAANTRHGMGGGPNNPARFDDLSILA